MNCQSCGQENPFASGTPGETWQCQRCRAWVVTPVPVLMRISCSLSASLVLAAAAVLLSLWGVGEARDYSALIPAERHSLHAYCWSVIWSAWAAVWAAVAACCFFQGLCVVAARGHRIVAAGIYWGTFLGLLGTTAFGLLNWSQLAEARGDGWGVVVSLSVVAWTVALIVGMSGGSRAGLGTVACLSTLPWTEGITVVAAMVVVVILHSQRVTGTLWAWWAGGKLSKL